MRIVLLVIVAFVVLGVALVALLWRLTRTKEDLFAARQDAARAHGRHAAAKRKAEQAEERCRQLLGHVQSLDAYLPQALSIARHVEAVSGQLHELIGFIASPDASEPRHAAVLEDAGHAALTSEPITGAIEIGARACTRTATRQHPTTRFTPRKEIQQR